MDLEFTWNVFPLVEVLRIEECRSYATLAGRRVKTIEVEYLVSRSVARNKSRQYSLSSEHPCLFRTFADLPPRGNAIASFSRTYGPLGLGEGRSASPAVDRRSRTTEYREEVDLWKEKIEEMGNMVSLWEAIASRNSRELEKSISFNERQQAIQYCSSTAPLDRRRVRPVIWRGLLLGGDPHSTARPLSDDVISQASYVLADCVNDQMKKYAGPPLLFCEEGCFRVRVVPKNLIGAMWSQFASAVGRRAEFGTCLNCDSYFEFHSAENRLGKRSGAKYCSDNCRVRASELRRQPKT
jgi:hypothetical protein